MRDAIPLSEDLQQNLSAKFTTVIRATVRGNIVVAVVQGALGGIAFWVLGIQGALLWAVLMAFLSLLPAVGTALVWLPVAIYLLATGETWQGIALIAFGVVVIGLVDNVLRPILVGKDTKLPDYVVLFATLGGLAVFGFNGFVIGPLIAAMFMAVWDTLAHGQERNRGGVKHCSVPAHLLSGHETVVYFLDAGNAFDDVIHAPHDLRSRHDADDRDHAALGFDLCRLQIDARHFRERRSDLGDECGVLGSTVVAACAAAPSNTLDAARIRRGREKSMCGGCGWTQSNGRFYRARVFWPARRAAEAQADRPACVCEVRRFDAARSSCR